MSLEEPNHIAKLSSLFNILLQGIIGIPIDFPGTRFHSSKKAASAIRTELLTIIKERRVEMEEGKASSSQDLLSHLLTSSDENGRYLTEMEIANNILILLFAGYDTSTVTITLLMKRLGEHPHAYDKVLKEQLDISKAKEVGELLKWEDLQKMKYSWNVISEVMRVNPPTIGAFREALVDFEYAGYTIPKGWKGRDKAVYILPSSDPTLALLLMGDLLSMMMMMIMLPNRTHKDEANFEDPTRFDPSRFEGSGPAPFTFVPFGGGPRMCLGKEFSRLEVLTFLHNIITNFKWDLSIPDEKIKYIPMAIPEKGLPVLLHPHQV
ncbi:putative cytochrome P450 [Helianthus anomalus]